MTSTTKRLIAFVAIAVVAVGLTVAYLVNAAGNQTGADLEPVAQPSGATPADIAPYIAFRQTRTDEDYGTVATVPYRRPGAQPRPVGLSCERIHMSRYGGICLDVDRTVATTARVLLLWPDMTVRHSLTTPGIPSRARVSPDGRWAASTTFVYGHSYVSIGFSTQTEIYDMAAGTSLGNLEDFDISYHGEPYDAADVNLWGVTFADDGNTFYATVMTDGNKFLGHGDIDSRSVEMLDVVVECPSLSPSGDRIAFKSATGPGTWEIKVRTLADGSEVTLDESRSVDDQIEWLDDDHVVYGMDREDGAVTDVWVAPADASGPAELLIEGAWSPAVVRGM